MCGTKPPNFSLLPMFCLEFTADALSKACETWHGRGGAGLAKGKFVSQQDLDTAAVTSMKARWRALPERLRNALSAAFKIALTGVFFYALLSLSVDDGKGGHTSLADAVGGIVETLSWGHFLPFIFVATGIKFVGILSSMWRWQLLLRGQGIHFNFGHIFGSFLIGRFLGTFLPSTVGLDGYKLYDASRFAETVVEPAAATVVEKALGFSGIFLTFLVALPFGYPVLHALLGDGTMPVVVASVVLSFGMVSGLALALLKPGLIEAVLHRLRFRNARVLRLVRKVSDASAAYRGKGKILAAGFLLSFVVHFTTAGMYYFTALAIGADGATFWEVTFASSIQILATVLTPFTIGGEGVREAAQALLLSSQIGAAAAALSAFLGFLAAEAPTMIGVVFLWSRGKDYRPKKMTLALADVADDKVGDESLTAGGGSESQSNGNLTRVAVEAGLNSTR